MEIAGTVLVFFFIGWFIDRRVGSTPWFMIVFVVLALVAQFLKLFYVYNAQMGRLETQRREAVHTQ
jgi:F0F1-type ATP synthase assembly protein I